METPIPEERQSYHPIHLDSEKILRYLIGSDDKLETLLICNPAKQRFTTTDEDIYHALASIKEYDDFRLNKLAKLFEVVSVRPVIRKALLTDGMVEKLREIALRN